MGLTGGFTVKVERHQECGYTRRERDRELTEILKEYSKIPVQENDEEG